MTARGTGPTSPPCNVYASHATPGADERPRRCQPTDLDEVGRRAVRRRRRSPASWRRSDAVGDRLLVARAGLIGGPGDHTGRSGYWVTPSGPRPARPDAGAGLGRPPDPGRRRPRPRRLAARRGDGPELPGSFNAVGPVVPFGSWLTSVAGVGGHDRPGGRGDPHVAARPRGAGVHGSGVDADVGRRAGLGGMLRPVGRRRGGRRTPPPAPDRAAHRPAGLGAGAGPRPGALGRAQLRQGAGAAHHSGCGCGCACACACGRRLRKDPTSESTWLVVRRIVPLATAQGSDVGVVQARCSRIVPLAAARAQGSDVGVVQACCTSDLAASHCARIRRWGGPGSLTSDLAAGDGRADLGAGDAGPADLW